jgi:hypothetical protein
MNLREFVLEVHLGAIFLLVVGVLLVLTQREN